MGAIPYQEGCLGGGSVKGRDPHFLHYTQPCAVFVCCEHCYSKCGLQTSGIIIIS